MINSVQVTYYYNKYLYFIYLYFNKVVSKEIVILFLISVSVCYIIKKY